MDLILVLIVVLVVVLIWRGPKTLPSLGKAFGQGIREARKEMDEIKTDVAGGTADPTTTATATATPATDDTKPT